MRTPLNGVIGMNEMMMHTELSYEQRKYVDLTRHAAESLLGMLNDVLDFSKIEDGKLTLEEIDFDLRGHLEKMVDIVAPQMLQRGVECISYIPPGVPTRLMGDPTRLRQVIINLLSNAVKFTDQGTVMVQVELESETERDASLRITVTDTGIGIPQDRQKEIFESFVQADATTTRKYGGSGLGLSICKQIVTAMKGEIGVDSEEGQGATFWVCVTLPKQLHVAEEEQPSDLELLRGKRVLIIDDEQANRHLFSSYLGDGFVCEIQTVADGYEALEALQQGRLENNPYDVALIDNKMPGMTGCELAKRIKGDPQLAEYLRIVMLTFFSDQGERRRMMEMGFDDYLNKPVHREELIRLLVQVIQNKPLPAAEGAQCDIDLHHMNQAHAAAKEPPQIVVGQMRDIQLNVLVVDDEPINQFFIKGVLVKQLNCTPDMANNGEQAMEMCQQQAYDLVFMDCQMPILDGYSATEKIRKLKSEKRPTVVALTGNSSAEDKKRAKDAGMDLFLEKPVSSETILNVIREHVEG